SYPLPVMTGEADPLGRAAIVSGNPDVLEPIEVRAPARIAIRQVADNIEKLRVRCCQDEGELLCSPLTASPNEGFFTGDLDLSLVTMGAISRIHDESPHWSPSERNFIPPSAELAFKEKNVQRKIDEHRGIKLETNGIVLRLVADPLVEVDGSLHLQVAPISF